METVLKVSGLNKSFGRHHIIKDVSFEVYAGEVFGFLGPNGAGKTTTIKMIMGFFFPDSGEISVCGHSLDREYEAAMANVGGIVENPELYKSLSGRKNLELYANLHSGVTGERIDEVIRLVGMENRASEKVKKYSLGMKQRIGLAQGMLHRPRLLILDEPTNGLDPAGIKELRTIIRELAEKENTAVFVSSHLLSEMELMCDRVAIISAGSVLGEKTVEELRHISNSETYIYRVSDGPAAVSVAGEIGIDAAASAGTDGTYVFRAGIGRDRLPELTSALLNRGVGVYTIEREANTLEDAFMQLTGGGNVIA